VECWPHIPTESPRRRRVGRGFSAFRPGQPGPKVSRRDDRGAAVVGPARRAWEVLGGRLAPTDQLARARELANQISDALGRPHRLVRVLDDNELDELEYRG
jgi:hypothetical protein